MSTNYYLHRPTCDNCGRDYDLVHVGKLSSGWRFLWRGHRGDVTENVPTLSSRDEWNAWLDWQRSRGALLFNESGDVVPLSEFRRIVQRSYVSGQRHELLQDDSVKFCRDADPEDDIEFREFC